MRELSVLEWSGGLTSPRQWDTSWILLLDDPHAYLNWLAERDGFPAELGDAEVIVVEHGPEPSFREHADRVGRESGDLRYAWLPDRHFAPDVLATVGRSLATGRTVRFLGSSPAPGEAPARGDSDDGATVIIAAFDSAPSVTAALRSLGEGSRDDIEVIVCDDGSDLQFLTEIAGAVRTAPWPTVYCWQPNRGFRVAASRNNGLRLGTRPTVIFLDGDMVPVGDFVADHLKQHDGRTPRVVVGNRLTVPAEVTALLSPHEHTGDRLRDLAHRSIPDDDTKTRVRDVESYGFHPWRAAFTCNLSVSGAHQLFDEAVRSPFGSEDVEWCYRLWSEGARVEVSFDVEAVHFGAKTPYPANLASASHEQLVLHVETMLYIIRKHQHESYMLSFLEALKLLELDPASRWRVGAGGSLTVYDSVVRYLRWREENAAEIARICSTPWHQPKE
ncbi:glycosyltransferase [Saccharomonospora azurea]|uniref:glycosyltransferase n=1 Tax=Saccharomonospora azurea TaxID=40988 RepID=UPI003D903646